MITPPTPVPPPERRPSILQRWQERGGVLGALASLALLVLKLAGPVLSALKFLSIGKFLITGGSMLGSMWLQAQVFGWPFAVGIVLLIFIHECGHALAAWRCGIPVKGMVFIPFMGAAVATRGGRSSTEDAFIGIMGPAVGTLACLACVPLYFVTRNPFFLALASWGFWVNLFNLAPMAPLDGGWIVPLFSPKLLVLGVVLLFVIAPHNPLIWILALMSLPRIIGGWKAKPDQNPFYQATNATRIKFGVAYLGLAAFLALGHSLVHDRILDEPTVPKMQPQQRRPQQAA